jgi:hypothetical protein
VSKLILTERTSLLILAVLCLLAAAAFLISDLTKPVVRKEADVIFLKGDLLNYSLGNKYVQSGKSRIRKMDFTFHLSGYLAKFRVRDKFEKVLDKAAFRSTAYNDSLQISIRKSDQSSLYTFDKEIDVYSIANSSKNYLDLKDAIRVYNGPGQKITAGIFLLVAVICFVYRWKKYSRALTK